MPRPESIEKGDPVEQVLSRAGGPHEHKRKGVVAKVEKSCAIVDFTDTKGVVHRERVLLSKLRVLREAKPDAPALVMEKRRNITVRLIKPEEQEMPKLPAPMEPVVAPAEPIRSDGPDDVGEEIDALVEMARAMVDRAKAAVERAKGAEAEAEAERTEVLKLLDAQVAEARQAREEAERRLKDVQHLAKVGW